MTESFIVCENLVKIYKVADLEVVALQGLDLAVAPGERLGIVGASGSGKSTLVEDVLVKSLRSGKPVGCNEIECNLKPVLVDQSPIGKNPRSTPATYTKLSDVIRDHYSDRTKLTAEPTGTVVPAFGS